MYAVWCPFRTKRPLLYGLWNGRIRPHTAAIIIPTKLGAKTVSLALDLAHRGLVPGGSWGWLFCVVLRRGGRCGCAARYGWPEIARISAEETKARVDAGTAVVVDVRSAEEYAAAHISGAVSIPLGEIQARSGELNPNVEIITYCT